MAPHPADREAADRAVRRLLADARATGPMPAEVADRLDATLADLVAERAAEESAAVVTPLRRRRWGTALLAAAAATIAGVALAPQLLDRGEPEAGTSSDTASLRDDQAGAVPSVAPEQAPPAARDEETQDRVESDKYAGPLPSTAAETIPGLDAALLQAGAAPLGALDKAAAPSGCGPEAPAAGSTTYVARQQPHVLVVLHSGDGARRVEVFDCVGDRPRTATSVVTLPPGE